MAKAFILHEMTVTFCKDLIKPKFNTAKASFCDGDSLKLSISNTNLGDTIKWYNGNSMEVSKDVPVPPDKRRYPNKVMEVGDSFFVDGVKLQVVCNNNYRTGKKLERKFIARCEKEGVRVWRTA